LSFQFNGSTSCAFMSIGGCNNSVSLVAMSVPPAQSTGGSDEGAARGTTGANGEASTRLQNGTPISFWTCGPASPAGFAAAAAAASTAGLCPAALRAARSDSANAAASRIRFRWFANSLR
jgi:hypothetical protein